MNRVLQLANFLGVLALAALCAFQWRSNRQVNLDRIATEKVLFDQSARLDEQARQIQGLTADLDDFRNRVGEMAKLLTRTEGEVRKLQQVELQLTSERDQLKESVTNWAAAVEARDDQIKLANQRLQELANDRNDAVTRFNELAQRYASAVNELNQRAQDYNALVAKYNALAKKAGAQ